MKPYSKGFTVIELTMTLIIVSVIAWILAEILRAPLLAVLYNRRSAEIGYLADLSIERIESAVRRAQNATLQAPNEHELQFKDENNHEITYQCRNHQIRQIANDQNDLMAPITDCRFEVRQEKGYLQVKIWLTFIHDKETPVSFYREVNLRDKV